MGNSPVTAFCPSTPHTLLYTCAPYTGQKSVIVLPRLNENVETNICNFSLFHKHSHIGDIQTPLSLAFDQTFHACFQHNYRIIHTFTAIVCSCTYLKGWGPKRGVYNNLGDQHSLLSAPQPKCNTATPSCNHCPVHF